MDSLSELLRGLDEAEQKVYPDGSVGWYTCRCSTCNTAFFGHKRDNCCGPCEAKIPVQVEMEI